MLALVAVIGLSMFTRGPAVRSLARCPRPGAAIGAAVTLGGSLLVVDL